MSKFLNALAKRVIFDGHPPREYGASLAWGLFVFLCRVILAAIFLLYATDKIADPLLFARSIAAYQILPTTFLINLTAVTLPWVELLAGLCLLFGVWRKGALLVTMGLLTMFTGMFVVTMIRGLEIDCGCFGGESPVGWGAIFRDLLMMLPGVFIFLNDWLIRVGADESGRPAAEPPADPAKGIGTVQPGQI